MKILKYIVIAAIFCSCKNHNDKKKREAILYHHWYWVSGSYIGNRHGFYIEDNEYTDIIWFDTINRGNDTPLFLAHDFSVYFRNIKVGTVIMADDYDLIIKGVDNKQSVYTNWVD